MCVATPPTTARRVRTWRSGGSVIVDLRLLPSPTAGGVNGIHRPQNSAPIAVCPAFSSVVMRYLAVGDGGGVGRSTATRSAAPFLQRGTRCDPHRARRRRLEAVSIVGRSTRSCAIRAFPARCASPVCCRPSVAERSELPQQWLPSLGCLSAVTCTDDSRRTATAITSRRPRSSHAIVLQPAGGEPGVFGNVLAVKTLIDRAPRRTGLTRPGPAHQRAGLRRTGGGAVTSDRCRST